MHKRVEEALDLAADAEALVCRAEANLEAADSFLAKDIAATELAEAVGMEASGGGFRNPLGRLRTLGLIEYPDRGRVRARDVLFLEGR